MKFQYTLTRPHLLAWAHYYIEHLREPGFLEKLLGGGKPKPGLAEQMTTQWTLQSVQLGTRIIEVDEQFKMILEHNSSQQQLHANSLDSVKHMAITPDYIFISPYRQEDAIILPTEGFQMVTREEFLDLVLQFVSPDVIHRED